MSKEISENGPDVRDMLGESTYQRYLELGGIINEEDYTGAIARAKNTTELKKALILQAEGMARFAGIELHNMQNSPDQRTILYGILREDVMPEEVKGPQAQTGDKPTSVYFDGVSRNWVSGEVRRHHSEMSDQQIFMEALRMLGDAESADKMIKAYPNISFTYARTEAK